MKILSVMNNHIEEVEKKDYGYGCTCDNCGTTFIFESSEAAYPRHINPKPNECYVSCPNCKNIITLAKCTKFKTSYELNDFKRIYDE